MSRASRSNDIGIDWNMFDLLWLENHLRGIKAVGNAPSSRFLAVLRQRRREAREAATAAALASKTSHDQGKLS